VKTVAKEEFFSIYGFYPGMYKLTLGAVGDFEERTVDARILMNEIWHPSIGRWSFNPSIDWCGDPTSNDFVAESIEQNDLPAGKFFILNRLYSGGDDKYFEVNLSAEVVDPKVIKGERYVSIADDLQSLRLVWQSDEMNYTFGYADFTTSNTNVPKVESTSVCYSTLQENDEITGELMSVNHQGYILIPREPEDGGLVVASVGEYIAKFRLSTDYDLGLTDKQLCVWLELWGFGIGDWQNASAQSGDSVIEEDALSYIFDINEGDGPDGGSEFSAKGSIVLSKFKLNK
jgi:hypothetical protein